MTASEAVLRLNGHRKTAYGENKLIQTETLDPLETNEISSEAKLILGPPPVSEAGRVKAWEEPVVIRTYLPAAPDRNPLFLEKRVYQGSSGRVYPLPVIDRIETEPRNHIWQAVHLENDYIRLMVLPQIGGRIHVGLDKLNDYDFFYRQNVIKPALVGLAGPWASGGVEFNWPQHHRPATFMPVEVEIERGLDGSVTVWCSDHDPMSRLKGMHGLCLHPEKTYLEVRVRLYNRTTDTQTFLWWANVATHVHEQYQAFFPKDARFAADHAKRAITEYPLSLGKYYGVDYGARAHCGVPEEEKPAHFVPDGSYPANDLGWYGNIPVPTSYMIVGSRGDFSGGYDHKRQAGMVAFGNHHIAPGKKQWTWGNQEFGYAWDRSLTDADGPYVELMAGVYTDNQPDFSFLSPGETKTFSQFWYPIREIGVPDYANIDAALRVEESIDGIWVHLQVTSSFSQSVVRCCVNGKEVDRWQGNLVPERPLHQIFAIPNGAGNLEVSVERMGNVILRYAPSETAAAERPDIATEPGLPEELAGNDELFLTGLHLEQYRHPTRYPETYWREAIRRDPGDSRSNHAMGRWHLRRGEFDEAERYLRVSIGRLIARNPNPYDGEPHYNLGMTLLYLRRTHEAYEAFYKSTWNAAWRGPAYHRLAEIDCCRHEWHKALDHVERSLCADTDNLNARNLKVIVLRKLDRESEAIACLESTRALDPLDICSRYLAGGNSPEDGQRRLDLTFDLLRAGLFSEAFRILSAQRAAGKDGTEPLLHYAMAHVFEKLGRHDEALTSYRAAASADSDYVFPSRLEEILLLQEAILANPQDARAPYYLGNLMYDRRRHRVAISLWERATELDPGFPTAWRNLGFGYFNVLHDRERALNAFRRARELAPEDGRILYEYDQLMKRTGEPLERRLMILQQYPDLVEKRDDLSVEVASLVNSLGDPEGALRKLLSRRFQPWEGGEGLVLAQYVRAHVLLSQHALQHGDAQASLEHLNQASHPPVSLSEAKHLLMSMSVIDYWLGVAYAQNGDGQSAAFHLERAARNRGDFQQMQVQEVSETTFWSAMALDRLNRHAEARDLFENILQYADKLERQTPRIDYFATSLPAMLLFDESLSERQTTTSYFLRAQAVLGLNPLNKSLGIDMLRQVLERDRSHVGAIDLLRMFDI
jgi:tetratricopeptide (TPR) repeat protein